MLNTYRTDIIIEHAMLAINQMVYNYNIILLKWDSYTYLAIYRVVV